MAQRTMILLATALTLLGCEYFWVDGEETWTDRATGLEWQNPSRDMRNSWEQAWGYCENLSWAGKTGWRMPGFDELKTIHDPVGHDVYGESCYWKRGLNGQCEHFWTSDTFMGEGESAYTINFKDATDPEQNMDTQYTGLFDNMFVRCVRN